MRLDRFVLDALNYASSNVATRRIPPARLTYNISNLYGGSALTETRLVGKQRSRPWYSWLFLVMFIITVLTMLYYGLVRTPKAKSVVTQLEREFNSVAPFPQATATHSEKSYKDNQALVLTRYSTSASYPVLRDYYDSELSKQGWKFISEEALADWGRDLGGKTAHYCKGDWSAAVEYAGQDSEGRGAYTLAMSWGLNQCK